MATLQYGVHAFLPKQRGLDWLADAGLNGLNTPGHHGRSSREDIRR